ncbi:MAG: molybdopterin biosynthesis protein, partial [Euryarchaeota archaeon]|nr:molybdopterin biosynthesis protein [Euryarchaeota archaeon]
PRRTERAPLRSAFGRTLAEDVTSQVDVPSFDRAAMDGYAVKARDTYTAREDLPTELRLTGSVQAGVLPQYEVRPGEAVEVATGAVLPKGANAEVMVEYVDIVSDNVVVRKPVTVHENVISAGSDVMVGELVLRKGTVLTEREIGALATIGQAEVAVFEQPRVAVLATGDEIVPPGSSLPAGKIYDVNTYSIGAAVRSSGGQPIYFGIVEDDLTRIEHVIDQALQTCDMVISSGSTSAGRGDVVYRIAERGNLLAHGVNIKPGKPLIIAELDGKPFFGLPGYPVSALMTYYVFIDPFIRGTSKPSRKAFARLGLEIHSVSRYELVPVNLVRGQAYPVGASSDAITTLLADGFLEIPERVDILEEGEEVEITLFGEFEVTDLMFIGSHDVGVDLLLKIIADVAPNAKTVNVGSQGGLVAVRKGITDIAGIHLLSESGEYNTPFIKEYGLHKVALVKGYLREQGIITRKGEAISLDELPNKSFINRNKGSGTRVLTDMLLETVAAKRKTSFADLTKSIQGYDSEARTHSAVASAVKFGKADVGIGIKPVAVMNGLEFTPVANEEYDFVIPQQRLDEPPVQQFIEALRSDEFAKALPPGIRIFERTGEILLIE